jgi:hypothetical protein
VKTAGRLYECIAFERTLGTRLTIYAGETIGLLLRAARELNVLRRSSFALCSYRDLGGWGIGRRTTCLAGLSSR